MKTSRELAEQLTVDIIVWLGEDPGFVRDFNSFVGLVDGECSPPLGWKLRYTYTTNFEFYTVMEHLQSGRLFQFNCENGGSWASLDFHRVIFPTAWEEVVEVPVPAYKYISVE